MLGLAAPSPAGWTLGRRVVDVWFFHVLLSAHTTIAQFEASSGGLRRNACQSFHFRHCRISEPIDFMHQGLEDEHTQKRITEVGEARGV